MPHNLYVPFFFFFEAYNVLTHCEVGSNVFIPFENCCMQNYILYILNKHGIESG